MKIFQIKQFLSILCFLFVTSCANYKINNFNSYVTTKIPNNSLVSNLKNNNSEIYSKRNVVIGDFDITKVQSIDGLNLNELVYGYMGKIVSESNYVNLLDRKISNKIGKEVSLNESLGKISNMNALIPESAEFIITGSIYEATFSSKMKSRTLENALITVTNIGLTVGLIMMGARDIWGSLMPYLGNQYIYESTVSGNVQIIDLSTMKPIINTNFSQTKKIHEEAESTQGSGLINMSSLKSANNSHNSDLITTTLKSGIDSVSNKLLQSISPRGYVVERRDFNEKSPVLFRLSFGTSDGVKIGDKVTFVIKTQNLNALTGKIDIIEEKLNIGYVSDNIFTNYSFVVVKDRNLAVKIQIGDYGLVNQ